MPRFLTSANSSVDVSEVNGLSTFVNSVTASAVNSLVAGAPTTLDTLNEIATSIGNNADVIDAVLLKTGGTMSGIIAMGGNAITGVSSISSNTITLTTSLDTTLIDTSRQLTIRSSSTSPLNITANNTYINIATGGGNNILLNAGAGSISLTGNAGVTLTTSGGNMITVGTTNISLGGAILINGVGVTTTGVLNGTITNGVMNSCSDLTSVIEINAGAGSALWSLPAGVTLSKYQQIVLYNKSSSLVTIGSVTTSAGSIQGCYSYRLFPKKSITLIYDLATSLWNTPQYLSDALNVFKIHKWSDDNMLNLFLNNNNTYIAKCNFDGSSRNTTINNVAGFTCLATGSGSGTNFTVSMSAAGGSGTNDGNILTATYSYGFVGYIYNFGTLTITITGLTPNRYYEICIYHQDYDGSTTLRSGFFTDTQETGNHCYQAQAFTSNSTNSPGSIVSWVFYQSYSTSRVFTITEAISYMLVNGFSVRNIGTSL